MRVLVTRPAVEARRWVDALTQHGFDATALPLIEITPLPAAAAAAGHWNELGKYRSVMFVSGNAVRHFFGLQNSRTEWPAQLRAWAPGTATAEVLVEQGVPATLIDAPAAGAAQFDSETLWQTVSIQVQRGDRILIVRGADATGVSSGRDWLFDQLVAAGAEVDMVAVYARKPPRPEPSQLALASTCATDGSVWLFSSSEAISHLQSLLPDQDWSLARAVATHARIGAAARKAGFGVVCESRPALDAVVAALESFR
jgi:uroporphyrinogen-III synthase